MLYCMEDLLSKHRKVVGLKVTYAIYRPLLIFQSIWDDFHSPFGVKSLWCSCYLLSFILNYVDQHMDFIQLFLVLNETLCSVF